MEEKNQKTIVAFIAGLLIGGLLVWVFFIASDDSDDDADVPSETPQTEVGNRTAGGDDTTDDTEPVAVAEEGQGAIRIADQAASARVSIESFTPPTERGWIVIHDVDADGELGRVLGAARFATTEGLMPKTVELLRATVPGATYMAVIYGDSGDRGFELRVDSIFTHNGVQVEDSFKAQ